MEDLDQLVVLEMVLKVMTSLHLKEQRISSRTSSEEKIHFPISWIMTISLIIMGLQISAQAKERNKGRNQNSHNNSNIKTHLHNMDFKVALEEEEPSKDLIRISVMALGA